MNKLGHILSDPKKAAALSGVAALSIGFLIGYKLGNRWVKIVTVEKTTEVVSPEREPDQDHPIMAPPPRERILQIVVPEPEEDDAPAITSPVEFAQDDPDWNYEAEIASRKKGGIYVIHRDEYFEEQMEYPQETVTYYEMDDILVDETDSPIYNHHIVVGELRFGHGSGDSSVFYVRNEQRKMEFEVVRNSGAYSVEVLGVDIPDNERIREIRHSRQPKFRME